MVVVVSLKNASDAHLANVVGGVPKQQVERFTGEFRRVPKQVPGTHQRTGGAGSVEQQNRCVLGNVRQTERDPREQLVTTVGPAQLQQLGDIIVRADPGQGERRSFPRLRIVRFKPRPHESAIGRLSVAS